MARVRRLNTNLRSKVVSFRDRFLSPVYRGEVFRKTVTVVRRRPVLSFVVALVTLFLLILLGNLLFKQQAAQTPKGPEVKNIQVFTIGQVPRIRVQAEVQKDGVIQIVAQSPGVVQEVNIKEGDSIESGTNLISLSTNYQGGNAATIQRQLAGTQLRNVTGTFNAQKELIEKQKQLAREGYKNTQELLQIAKLSLDDNNVLMNLNKTIISSIEANLLQLQNNNFNNQNSALILATQQQLSSMLSAQAQLGIQARNLGQQIDPANAPKSVNELNRDIAVKQLEVQEKSLELSRQSAALQFKLAQVQESLMFPVSPCSATVQKVHVSFGQNVSPGTQLVTLYCPQGNISADAKIPSQIAKSISSLEPSIIYIDDQSFTSYPRFVSTQATDGQLHSVVFDIPENYQELITNNAFISIEIPIGDTKSNSAIPFIPLDAVFQTQDQSFVYVVEEGKAGSRVVQLGQVLGDEVEIISGLKDSDQVILNRNVIAGDNVRIQ